MGTLHSQNVILTGEGNFIPIDQDFEYFIYDSFVYNIQDFKDYQRYNMDKNYIQPISTEEEWEERELDEREYYNIHNLYGSGEEIHLGWPKNYAVLTTDAKGF